MPILAENETGISDPVEVDLRNVRTFQIEFHEDGTEVQLQGQVDEADSFGNMDGGNVMGNSGESQTLQLSSPPVVRLKVFKGEASAYYR